MAEMGKAMMGTGEASGEDRALVASQNAIANPLLDEVSLKGARAVLVNVTGGLDMTLLEVDEAANAISDQVDPEANIIFGAAFDPSLEGKIRVSVVATGIDAEAVTMAPPAPAKVFAFPGATRAAAPAAPKSTLTPPEPVAEAEPEPEVAETAEPEVLDLAAAPEAEELTLETPAEESPDELLLGGEMASDEDEGFVDEDFAGGPEARAPGTRSWLIGDEPAEAAPEAKPSREGGTLFERMSNIARGAAKAQVDEEPAAPARNRRDPLDIPRFLGRQNNQ
jgi:cell division protein FtsZ